MKNDPPESRRSNDQDVSDTSALPETLSEYGAVKRRIEEFGIENITRLVAEGETLRNIAKRIGASAQTLVEQLRATPERARAYEAALVAAAQMFDEMALEVLESATTNIEVQRAREIAAHYRWRAKAANPKRYSDKVQIDANVKTETKTDAEVIEALQKYGITVGVKRD